MSALRRSRALGASIVALGLVAAACGDDEPADTEPVAASTSTDAPADEPVATDAPAVTEAPGDESADEPSEEPSDEPGAAAGGTVVIDHYSGSDEVPVDPETIVVMDLGMLVTLDALGIEADGFGSLGTPVPEQYQALVDAPEPVGTAFEPDYEAINALEPDLIIVATRSSATYPEMSEIAPTVDLTFDESLDPIAAFEQRHEQLGQIFGIEDEVAAELEALDAEIEALAARTGDAGSALIVLTSGAEVSAYGAGSRFGMVHDVFGYAAADETLQTEETHGEVVSFEYLLDVNPDVMFVVDRSAAIGEEAEGAETILDNELVNQTNAWQNERVVYVDAFSWYLAGNSIPGLRGVMADIEASLP